MEAEKSRITMDAGIASVLKAIGVYRDLDYPLHEDELQALGYFLQVAGQDLKLHFEKHTYGPYSEELRHALNRMEGHFIVGLGDGVVDSEIEPTVDALAEADAFIASAGEVALNTRLTRLQALIDGFQSPYGMELLATMHWVTHHESDANSPEGALAAIRSWNSRKKKLMQPSHVDAAWQRLAMEGWLAPERALALP
jgi:hypothetical protein